MFTGLVSEIGTVVLASRTREGKKLLIKARNTAPRLKKGDSVSVNGACQTANFKNGTKFSVLVVQETLKRTNLGHLQPGNKVNLELPLKLSDRLGGHYVTGHIDAKVRLQEIVEKGGGVEWWVELPNRFTGLVVEKGSVALDGVSLTIAAVKAGRFRVALIPYTLKATTLGAREAGDFLNIEFDLLGKYAVNCLSKGGSRSALTREMRQK